MPNAFAYLVLLSWPLITCILFLTLPRTHALVISIVGGYLILPQQTGFDLPLLPVFDKHSIPALSSAFMCLVTKVDEKGPFNTAPTTEFERLQRRNPRKIKGLYICLTVLLIASAFMTTVTNGDPVIYGIAYKQGMRIYDAFSIILGEIITILPFLLGWKYLSSESDHVIFLKILIISGLCYSLLALFEVRMSPQLNAWIYGFFPHSFAQHIRGDGFRPIVFLQHGLWVSIFFTLTILSAVTLLKANSIPRSHIWLILTVTWLMITLFLTKSLGAFALALLFVPMVLIMGVKGQMLVAMCVAGIVLLYPMLRGADLVPTHKVVNLAENIDPQRAASLVIRIENEEQILEKTNERPMFGWGGWGRAEIYDPNTGRAITILDGAWLIAISSYGWIGYIARFGFLTFPIFMLALTPRQMHITAVTSGLCLILAVSLIDLVPNATLTSVTWLIAGALAGFTLKENGGMPETHHNTQKTAKAKSVLYKRAPRGASHTE